MELMRHTDARLTTRIYTAPRLLDTASAVNALPRLTRPPSSEESDPSDSKGSGHEPQGGTAAGAGEKAAKQQMGGESETLAFGLVSPLAEPRSPAGSGLTSDVRGPGPRTEVTEGIRDCENRAYGIACPLPTPCDLRTSAALPAAPASNIRAQAANDPSCPPSRCHAQGLAKRGVRDHGVLRPATEAVRWHRRVNA